MKNMFNFNLYKETFRQLRITGLIMTVIMIFIGAIIPISAYISVTQDIDSGFYPTDYQLLLPSNDFSIFLIIIFVIAAPMLTLSAFSFLSKRNTCDFYHSIPHKRTAIYFSILASVISWLAIILFSNVLVTVIFFKIFSKHIVFNAMPLIITAINHFVSALLVTASVSFACSITGTLLNNVLVSGLIIFLPRILIFCFTTLIVSTLPFVYSFDTFFLLKNDINLIIGTLYNLLSGYDYMNLASFGGYTVYTLILAILYILLAAWMFKKRKSEAAGSSSVNNKVQLICRLCIGIIFTLPAIIELYYIFLFSNYNSNLSELILFIVIDFIIAITAMFIYELITTKKIMKALKTFITAPVLLIIDAALILFLIFMFNKTLNFVPEIDEISYISFGSYNEYDETEYFDMKKSTVQIKDKELIQLLTNAMSDNIEDYNGESFYTHYNYAEHVRIIFNCDGKEYKRLIYLSPADAEKYNNILENLDIFKKIYLDIPDINDKNTTFNDNFLSNEKSKAVYEKLYSEIQSNPTPLLNYFNGSNSYDIDTLYFSTNVDDRIYYGHLPILAEYEESTQLYLNYTLSEFSSSDLATIRDILNNLTEYIYSYDEVIVSLEGMDEQPTVNEYSDYCFVEFYNSEYDTYYMLKNEENLSDKKKQELELWKSYLNVPNDEDIEFYKAISTYIDSSLDFDADHTIYMLEINIYSNFYYAEDEIYYSYCIPISVPNTFFN